MRQLVIVLLFFVLVSCFSLEEKYKPLEGEQPAQELFVGEWKPTEQTYKNHQEFYKKKLNSDARLFLNNDKTLVLQNFVYGDEERILTEGKYHIDKGQYWQLNFTIENKEQLSFASNVIIQKNQNGKIFLTFFLPGDIFIYFEKVSE